MAKLTATAYSPGTVGNLAVGFDLLGHCVLGIGDRVTARSIPMQGSKARASIGTIQGLVTELPTAPEQNTASRAVQALLDATDPQFDVVLDLEKGIPLGSGLGGSAASATAALVASNALLDQPLEQTQLYPYALHGESIASAQAVGDNVGPQLAGGLTLATTDRLIPLPVPPGLTALVIHPRMQIETTQARICLEPPFPLTDITKQQAGLAQLLVGLYAQDFELIARGLTDHLIEPRRASLIPGLESAKAAAIAHGALGASISGAGPSLFAWFENRDLAEHAKASVCSPFSALGIESTAFITPVDAPGARLEVSDD